MTTVLPKDKKKDKSPWFDQQRHYMLRDNLTHTQRVKEQN